MNGVVDQKKRSYRMNYQEKGLQLVKEKEGKTGIEKPRIATQKIINERRILGTGNKKKLIRESQS